MSNIPYNYHKYIADVTKLTQRGHISSGEQEQFQVVGTSKNTTVYEQSNTDEIREPTRWKMRSLLQD